MEDKKTAIITGASSGIGEAIVTTLRDAGWHVVGLTSADCDLADLTAVGELAQRLRQEYVKVDALIHVAGVYHSQDEVFTNRDLEDYDPAWIAATMNVGVTSLMILTAQLMPNITKNGVVIGLSGTFNYNGNGAEQAGDDLPGVADGASGWLPYYTSKRALEDFLVGLAQDYRSGPFVYGISPSDTHTPAYAKFFPEAAKLAQPPNSVSLLVEHLLKGDSPYQSGDIIVVKDKVAVKGYHA